MAFFIELGDTCRVQRGAIARNGVGLMVCYIVRVSLGATVPVVLWRCSIQYVFTWNLSNDTSEQAFSTCFCSQDSFLNTPTRAIVKQSSTTCWGLHPTVVLTLIAASTWCRRLTETPTRLQRPSLRNIHLNCLIERVYPWTKYRKHKINPFRLCAWSFALLSIRGWPGSALTFWWKPNYSMQMTSYCFGRSVGRMTSSSSSMTSHWLRIR